MRPIQGGQGLPPKHKVDTDKAQTTINKLEDFAVSWQKLVGEISDKDLSDH